MCGCGSRHQFQVKNYDGKRRHVWFVSNSCDGTRYGYSCSNCSSRRCTARVFNANAKLGAGSVNWIMNKIDVGPYINKKDIELAMKYKHKRLKRRKRLKYRK